MNRRGSNIFPCATPEMIGIHSLVAPLTDSLPAVREELSTNGQHTGAYTDKFQFEKETAYCDVLYQRYTKVDLNDIRLHPFIYGLLTVKRYARTFPICKLSSRQKKHISRKNWTACEKQKIANFGVEGSLNHYLDNLLLLLKKIGNARLGESV